MNTAEQVIEALNICRLDLVKALDIDRLRKLEALCHHWQQLADREIRRRVDQESEPPAT
jgi:hypothetical protein